MVIMVTRNHKGGVYIMCQAMQIPSLKHCIFLQNQFLDLESNVL